MCELFTDKKKLKNNFDWHTVFKIFFNIFTSIIGFNVETENIFVNIVELLKWHVVYISCMNQKHGLIISKLTFYNSNWSFKVIINSSLPFLEANLSRTSILDQLNCPSSFLKLEVIFLPFQKIFLPSFVNYPQIHNQM